MIIIRNLYKTKQPQNFIVHIKNVKNVRKTCNPLIYFIITTLKLKMDNLRRSALAASAHDYNNGGIGDPGGSGVQQQQHQQQQQQQQLQRWEESNIFYDYNYEHYLCAFNYNYGINYNNVSFNSGRDQTDFKNIQEEIKHQQELINKIRKWVPIQSENTTNGLYFTVLNYNVLAQDLVQENSYLYKNHSARACLWETRWNNLYREITSYNADIICLQEVQESHLNSHYKKFETNGYAALYKKRTGMRPDGCAIYYKKSAFKLLENTTIEFNQNANPLDRENVAIIARFSAKENPDSEFVVATTHLLYNPRRMDVRLAQTQVLLAEIERVAYKSGAYVPIIITGDFNSKPDSAVYKLLTNGRIRYDHLTNRTLVAPSSTNDTQTNGKYLLAPRLKITDTCQHYELVKMRKNGGVLTRAQELSLIALRHSKRHSAVDDTFIPDPNFFSTGTLTHRLNLLSAFKHVADNDFEATTHQNQWITVDYIFYSGKYDNRTGRILEDKLKLIENFRIPTASELEQVKYIPNLVIGSDHLPLLSKFKLIY